MLSYDLHLHSCLSPCADDDMTPGNILGMASLIGLDLIAVTDHNSCKNCPSLFAQAKHFPLEVIAGMELNTAEEVHVLCYFKELENAMEFDSYVEEHLVSIPNHPEIFGRQLLCNKEDCISGTLDNLLISATDISFFHLEELLKKYQGIMVPAHIDKSSNSLLSNLGFVPLECDFPAFEVRDPKNIRSLQEKYSLLKDCQVLCSSDAHRLTDLHEREYFLERLFPLI